MTKRHNSNKFGSALGFDYLCIIIGCAMNNELLKSGEYLPLVESFYTLQGEGYNTGRAAFFVRIGGCDTRCSWCDSKESWNWAEHPVVSVRSIVEQACMYHAKLVVITGGEPLSYPLDKLCELLKEHNFETLLETSGSYPLSGRFDWICLSPKRNKPPLPEIYKAASELKVIVAEHSDFMWAEKNRELVGDGCRLYLQPEWGRRDLILPDIIEYIKSNPYWTLSLQTHKFINIP